MSDVYGQKGYCHDHGKYRPCSKCQDVLIDIGIQIDKDRIRELEAMATWQPIETAPKSGEFLLGVWSGNWDNPKREFTVFHARGYKDGPSWAMRGRYRTDEGGAYKLAGWLPLPPPPEGEAP